MSYRLPKVLSNRNVCDILIVGVNPQTGKMFVLIRWDFLASKFQIPAKGLEDFDADLNSTEAAKFVVSERLLKDLIEKFEYRYVGKIKTSHVGAGSLGDGPILRNFFVSVFKLEVRREQNNEVLGFLNEINQQTIRIIEKTEQLGETVKRALNYYVWAELSQLERKRNLLLGKKLQGFLEIISDLGIELFKNSLSPVILNETNKLPVIETDKIENEAQLDYILKEY